MANIAKNLTDLIGNTPLLELSNYNKEQGVEGTIIAKVESFNPASSVKDRIAYAMLKDAREQGIIKEGATVVEATSGNTGIGLAFTCAALGYKLILAMPDTMSLERRNLLKALGVELLLTPGAEGMKGAIDKAEEVAASIDNVFVPRQFENASNPKIHEETTGQEIWRDTDGKVDIFVAGVGTGGTISGVGRALKAHNPEVQVVAVEPITSAVLSGDKKGPHKIQGIGAGFIPKNYDDSVIDEIYKIHDEEAFATSRKLAETEGLLVGISSGAAAYVATQIALRPENKDKNIVVLLPDSGERYLSTTLYTKE